MILTITHTHREFTASKRHLFLNTKTVNYYYENTFIIMHNNLHKSYYKITPLAMWPQRLYTRNPAVIFLNEVYQISPSRSLLPNSLICTYDNT